MRAAASCLLAAALALAAGCAGPSARSLRGVRVPAGTPIAIGGSAPGVGSDDWRALSRRLEAFGFKVAPAPGPGYLAWVGFDEGSGTYSIQLRKDGVVLEEARSRPVPVSPAAPQYRSDADEKADQAALERAFLGALDAFERDLFRAGKPAAAG
jgi:hypothetical protein